ncbi:E3 ubiquitin-protein ligase RMA1-like [Miscanthus floridulus]|uniref:E3 ubiquitin-protein ligase RMA1-like n=1 Tax=Miscanthus floridulus TaxID=154761 RepID=UPI003459DA1E
MACKTGKRRCAIREDGKKKIPNPQLIVYTLTEPPTEIRLLFSSSPCPLLPHYRRLPCRRVLLRRSRVRRPKHRRGLAPPPRNHLPLAAPPSPSPEARCVKFLRPSRRRRRHHPRWWCCTCVERASIRARIDFFFLCCTVITELKQFLRASITIAMEAGRMDQPCMAAINSQPFMADIEPVKKANGDMPATTGSGCFDCNICLDFAAEPVVTLCGHLYCWPCIYEWLRPGVESTASDNSSSARRQCPVCKATLSMDTLVPLYGRGGNSKKSLNGMAIPRRPMVHRETVEQQNAQSNVNDQRYHQSMEDNPQHQPLLQAHHHPIPNGFDFIYPPAPVGRGLIHSTAGGVLGGMAEVVLPWALRGQLPASLYYTSPYHVATENVNPRLRRHQMEIERSLHQIWFFLFVFVVLCLLLF